MNREEILLRSIDEIAGGKRSLDECAAMYPDLAVELRALVKIIDDIGCATAAPTEDIKRRVRIHLQLEMAREGVGHRWSLKWPRIHAPERLFYAVTVATLLLAIGSGGTVYASRSSLPSDRLYGVKTGTEKLQLALTFNTVEKAELHLKLAERRVAEVIAESWQERGISAQALQAAAGQIDGAIRAISSMPPEEARPVVGLLLQATLDQQVSLGEISRAAPEAAQPALMQAIDVTRRGNLIAQMASSNPAFLSTGVSARDEKIELASFEIEGRLQSIDGQTWNIDGVTLLNVNTAETIPSIGSRLAVKGIVRDGRTFVSKVEPQDDSYEGLRVKGILGGTTPDRTVWNVGGIPLGHVSDINPPPAGARVDVSGKFKDGSFVTSGLEHNAVRSGESSVNGVLQKVDADKETISMNMAGTQVTINVSGATIKDDDGRTLGMNEIQSTTGKDVQASSIYKSGDKLFARDIHVDTGRGSERARSDDRSSQGSRTNAGERADKPGDGESKPEQTSPGRDGDNTSEKDRPSSRTNDDSRSGDTRSDSNSGSGDKDSKSGDSRSGSGDRDSGSGDSRSGSGDRDSGSGDSRSGSGDRDSRSGSSRD